MSFTRIHPRRRLSFFEWKEVFEYRDLLYYLSLRDIQVRYKQTRLGVVWVILQPLVPAVIFAVLFGYFARLPSNGHPYLLMVFTGLIPWSLFSNTIGRAGSSLVGNANLLSKIYFPRLIIPLASMGSVVVDCLVGLVVLVVLLALFGVGTGWHMLAAPFFLLVAFLMGFGLTLIVASLNVYHRDFGYIVPFFLQAWNYITPIVYSSSLIPAKWLFLYSLNPSVGIIEGFRWSVLGGVPITSTMFLSMVTGLLSSLFIGMIVFQRIERGFADIV